MSCGSSGLPQRFCLTKANTSELASSQQLDVRLANAESRIAKLISRIQPNRQSKLQRNAVADYVSGLVRKCLDCEVFRFGSVPLKTYLPDGDIDLTAFSSHQELKDSWAFDVQTVLEHEVQRKDADYTVSHVQCIYAEVKIVKCVVENLVVDISFNQLGGLCTLCFLEEVDRLVQKNHLFKRSIILVKAWCYYESRILGAHHALISTYALETLVLYILNVFHSTLRGPLEVLSTFLDYFSKFDWEKYCLTVWGPLPLASLPDLTAEPPLKDGSKLLLSKGFLESCRALYDVFPKGGDAQARTFGIKYLNIVDPLRINNNLGRSVNQANLYRIKKAFRTGAHQLAQVFEVVDDDFPESLDGFFSNTWERHQSGPRPDAPTSYFPPFEKFVYEPGCFGMLGDACLFISPESKTSGLLSTGKITEKDNSYRPDSVDGFTDVHHNRITHLACPVVLKTSVNTQSNLTCNMPIAVTTDSLLRTSSVRKASSDKGQSMDACKAPASFTPSDSERGHEEMLDSGMINNCGSPTTKQHFVVGESPLMEDRLAVYKSGCSPVEGGQGAEMSSDGLRDFTLSKAASDTFAVTHGQGTENISFVRGKSWPTFTSRDSNKTSSGNTAISNNMRAFSPFSALEKLIRSDTATQKPPDFLFPELRDLLYAPFIPSRLPPVASSSSSTVTSSPFIQSSSFSELHGERAQDLACPTFMEAQPSKTFKDTFQEPASDDVQGFASPVSQLHAVTVLQMPSQHQVFEEQQPEQAWSQLHVNREQRGMSLFFLNNQASTLAETKGGNDGSNMKRGTSITGHMAVPSEAQELSSTKSLDERMHLRVGRLDKSIEAAHQFESTASTTSSYENLLTTASSWCHIFPTNGEVSQATIPDYAEGLSSVGAIAPQPFGNVDVFESDLFETGMTKASSVQEEGNFVSQIPANWCSPTGDIPLVPYHNPYHSVFPAHSFSPQIPYEREVFLHRQKLPQIYSGSGQTFQSSAAALSARFALLSAEETELQPSKDLLRSNLANHLLNLEFGRWCEEPALQPLSPMYHHAQDPYYWGVSPFLPLQGSCNQMVDSPKALVPVLIGGMPHVISAPVTSGVGHLQKQETGRETFVPVINGMHKDLKPVSPHRAWQHELWHSQKKTHSSPINDTSAAPTLIASASCHDACHAVTNVQADTNTADEHGGMASHFTNLANSFGTGLPLVAGQLEFGSLGPIDITSFPCSRTGSKQS